MPHGRESLSITDTQHNDVLTGQFGDDIIVSTEGADILLGGEGNDILVSGIGDSVLVGGVGNDRFIINDGNDAMVTIYDLGHGDTINLDHFSDVFSYEDLSFETVNINDETYRIIQVAEKNF